MDLLSRTSSLVLRHRWGLCVRMYLNFREKRLSENVALLHFQFSTFFQGKFYIFHFDWEN